MAASFADIIADVESDLYSFSQGSDAVSWLTAALTADATSASVNDASLFDAGWAEITSSTGNEIVYVSSKDEDGSTITMPPWGRGERGTTALAHPSNARIVANPQFPRSRIAQAINEAVTDSYPSVFAVDSTDVALTTGTEVYTLPDDCDGLLDVSVTRDNHTDCGWEPLRRFAFSPSDHKLNVAWSAVTGYSMRVVYRKVPVTFDGLTSTLDDVGLGDQCRSMIRVFAYYKMLSALQSQRLQVASVEAEAMVQLRQPDYVNNAVKTTYAQFQVLLQAQQDRLRVQYPPIRYRTP